VRGWHKLWSHVCLCLYQRLILSRLFYLLCPFSSVWHCLCLCSCMFVSLYISVCSLVVNKDIRSSWCPTNSVKALKAIAAIKQQHFSADSDMLCTSTHTCTERKPPTSFDKFLRCFFPNPCVCASYYDDLAINSTFSLIHCSITEPPEIMHQSSISLSGIINTKNPPVNAVKLIQCFT